MLRLKWQPVVQFAAVVEVQGRDRKLAVSAVGADGEWAALAIEVAADCESLTDFFAQHSHDVIGDGYLDDIEAREAALAYAQEWLKGAEPLRLCECEDIDNDEVPYDDLTIDVPGCTCASPTQEQLDRFLVGGPSPILCPACVSYFGHEPRKSL